MADFRILGPLEIISDDGTEAKVCPRERTLVAVLLLFAGFPCSRKMLARALWGDSAPADPAAALRVCVCRARRALGPANCLTTLDGAFRADPAPADLDLTRFGGLLSEADRAAGRGDLENAASALERALACWRNPPLADLPDSPEVAPERARLLGERRGAELALTDTLLALGQHERIVADLHAMVVVYPLSERAWAQLMLALYLCGRRSEALAAYAKARSALRPPRGGVPRDELQAVLTMVLEDWPAEEAARSRVGGPRHGPAAQPPRRTHGPGLTSIPGTVISRGWPAYSRRWRGRMAAPLSAEVCDVPTTAFGRRRGRVQEGSLRPGRPRQSATSKLAGALIRSPGIKVNRPR